MKEPITISLTEFYHSYPDHFYDAKADIDWPVVLKALDKGDSMMAGNIILWCLSKARNELEDEINNSTELSQSEIDEDNRLMDNRDRIRGME